MSIGCNFTWTINSFVGGKFEFVSPPFSIGTTDVLEWQMKVTKQTNGDDVSLYVLLPGCKSEVTASVKCGILNKNGQKVEAKTTEKLFAKGVPWGWKAFTTTSFLQRHHLLNNSFTLFCDVTINSITRHFPVPPCTLGNDFHETWKNQKSCDVTFYVAGMKFPAHKHVLEVRSSVFKAMFEHNMTENLNNVVQIEDLKAEVFEEILRFVYSGKVHNLSQLAEDLLVAADKYSLDRLKLLCEEELWIRLSVENAARVIILADRHRADILKRLAIDYIIDHAGEFSKNSSWDVLATNYPELITDVFNNWASKYLALKQHFENGDGNDNASNP